MKFKDQLHIINKFIGTKICVLWCILIMIIFFFISVLYYGNRGINYSYQKGDIVETDIKSPKDFFIEDKEATEKKREEKEKSILITYDFDAGLSQKISDKIYKTFEIIQKKIGGRKQGKFLSPSKILQFKEQFETMLNVSISEDAFAILFKNKFSYNIAEKTNKILIQILTTGIVANKEILLKEESKGIILKTIETEKETIITNLKIFHDPNQAKTMVRIVGNPILKGVDYSIRNVIVELCQNLLQPNITINKNETEKRIKQAKLKIKPVLYKIKAGEMLLREGERVDEIKLIKLKAMKNQFKEKNLFMAQIGTGFIIFFLLLVIYIILFKEHKNLQRHHNKNIIFISSILILFVLIAKFTLPIVGSVNLYMPIKNLSVLTITGLPLSAGAMLVCLFLGFDIAIYFSLVLSIFATLIFSSSIEIFIFFFLSSIIAAFWTKDCKERKGFIAAGLKLAIFNSALVFSLSIYSEQIQFSIILKNFIFAFSGGIIAGIITAGLTPIIEILFDYTTDIKFLELANLDQPIMKRLMIEAPGTYNHSLIVANLAEAAASAIDASTLKTKVCAFYHDIGKLNKPLYFIENQTDGKNRHDKLSPSISALILIEHIKKGVEIARANRLGMEIIDTIKQHHGTSLIKYFYNKSIKINGKDAVKENDFRYPYPKPQTREIGIIMLADVIEAAIRTLDNPTSAKIQGQVQVLINNIFADGQLEECELTLKDLHQIAKSFNKILTGLYHHRIEYTDKPQEKKKEKNEIKKNSDTDSNEKKRNFKTNNKQQNKTNLKRLGI
ncbi:MAG: HD family phosphohydrolase [Desulfobacteraceae bacterium 4572_130]|nr:MAG: HD family phosphohydrolase [Desulfobacteraceae bacterium 4572_130]